MRQIWRSMVCRSPWPKNWIGGAALVWMDDRFEYNEIRMIALAPKSGILYFVAYVDRSHVRRIISLRRANRREVKHYVQNA